MVFEIDKNIFNLYSKGRKNIDYMLRLLLEAADRKITPEVLKIIMLPSEYEPVSIEISKENVDKIERYFRISVDNEIVRKLVMIALMFPEI